MKELYNSYINIEEDELNFKESRNKELQLLFTQEDKPIKLTRYFYKATLDSTSVQIEIDNEYIKLKKKEIAEAHLKAIAFLKLKKILHDIRKEDIEFNFYRNERKINFEKL